MKKNERIDMFVNDLIKAEEKSFHRDENDYHGTGIQDYDEMAEILTKKGYGNIKKFVEKLKERIYEHWDIEEESYYLIREIINNLLKEFLKNE